MKLEDYFLDGTKIEANANKYTFVWNGSTLKYNQKLDEKFQQIVLSIEEITKEDEQAEQEKDLQEKLEETNITSQRWLCVEKEDLPLHGLPKLSVQRYLCQGERYENDPSLSSKSKAAPRST